MCLNYVKEIQFHIQFLQPSLYPICTSTKLSLAFASSSNVYGFGKTNLSPSDKLKPPGGHLLFHCFTTLQHNLFGPLPQSYFSHLMKDHVAYTLRVIGLGSPADLVHRGESVQSYRGGCEVNRSCHWHSRSWFSSCRLHKIINQSKSVNTYVQ